MKKIFKGIGYIMIVAFFAVSLSGCSLSKKKTPDPDLNKLTIWSFEEEDAWKPIIKSFNKNNKAITVVYKKQTLDSDYESRVLNSVLSGQGPDIWAMPNDWVYRHKEKLVPMPESLVKITDLDKGFVPSIKESVYFDNKIYALSPSSEPLMVYYNPKLFSQTLETLSSKTKDTDFKKRANKLLGEVPSLWSDFTDAVKLLTVKNGDQIQISGVSMGTSTTLNSQDVLYLLMMQNETQIISDDLSLASFNLPGESSTGSSTSPGRKALEFYSSFASPASPNYAWNNSLGDSIDAFGSGKTAMIFGYSSLQNTLLQRFPTLQYRKAYMPQQDQEAANIRDFARFNAFGISKLSKNPALAWQLVYGLSTESASDFNSASRLYTSKKATEYDINIKNRNSSNPEKLSLATAHSLIKGRYPGEFDSLIKEAIDNVNAGKLAPQSSLDLSANKATEFLRKDTW